MAISEKALPFVYAVTPLIGLAILAVALRLHVRLFLVRNAGADDWLCIAAMVLAIVTYVANMIAVVIGFGKPFPSLSVEDQLHIRQAMWISPAIWGLSSALIKMSIITSYLRIWTVRGVVRLCKVLLVIMTLFGLVLFFGDVLACIPVEVSWQMNTIGDNRCINKPLFLFITSIINIVLDILVYLLPVPLILKLRLPRSQRVALLVPFTIGGVVCVASAMRLVVIHELPNARDESVTGINLSIWSNVEANLAIICACLPALRPIFSRIFPKLLGSVGGSSNNHWFGRRKTQTFNDRGGYRSSHQMYPLSSVDEPAIILPDFKLPIMRNTSHNGEEANDHSWLEEETPACPPELDDAEGYMFIRYGKEQKSTIVVPAPVVVKNFSHPAGHR
ncbi:Uu.00g048290.m01.CDS01 [Anthostomella pinea]|uniref:Uu.00g048290.m01.CDS01 n=1 Tax=Anthostomella pinea TaxID=933095 RepID=A0AAI8YEK8_9PEZI|nr:Uu.00g048290.m01.CDS01 [Anthostomella pinea]